MVSNRIIGNRHDWERCAYSIPQTKIFTVFFINVNFSVYEKVG